MYFTKGDVFFSKLKSPFYIIICHIFIEGFLATSKTNHNNFNTQIFEEAIDTFLSTIING